MAIFQTEPPRTDGGPSVEVVRSAGTRAEAEACATELLRGGARPGSVFVAARELHEIERGELVPPASVTVAQGAASSAIGAGVVVGLFGALDPTISALGVLGLAFYALVFGAVGGALIGGLFYALRTRGAGDVAPAEAFTAERFDVLVRPERE